jgi:ribonuclease P protein component
MLKKSQRLTTEEVNLLMEKGLFAQSPLFTARYMKVGASNNKEVGTEFNTLRVSAICSSKVGKTAVIRNKARRRVYEAVGSIIGKNVSNVSICIICKSGAIDADFKTFKADLSTLLTKVGVL